MMDEIGPTVDMRDVSESEIAFHKGISHRVEFVSRREVLDVGKSYSSPAR